MTARTLAAALMLAAPTLAEVRPTTTWRYSVAALAAANAADAHSSWRGAEANPLLADSAGRFSHRGLAVKGGIAALNVGVQYIVVRKWPKLAKPLSYVNFTGAAFTGAVAARNYGVRP